MVHHRLHSMGESAQLAPELIFQTSEPGVKQGRVEHHLIEQGGAQLIEPGFDGRQHVLAVVMYHLEQSANIVLDLKQLVLQGDDLAWL